MSETKAADGDTNTGGGLRGTADRELVERVKARDQSALDVFVARLQCVPRFLVARNRQLAAGLDAEALADLTQDVLAELWRRLGDYRGEAALETWAYRFCDFALRNAARRDGVRRAVAVVDPGELGQLVGDAPAAAGQAAAERAETIEAGLRRLRPDEAAVVRCKHFDGLTFDAMAARLGVPANTCKTRYYRAMQVLGRWLARAAP